MTSSSRTTRFFSRLTHIFTTFFVVLRNAPVSACFAFLFIVTALVCGTFFSPPSLTTKMQWAVGVTTLIQSNHWWSVFTSLAIPWDPFQLVAGVLAALLLLGVAERLMGPVRLVFTFLVSGVIGVTLGTVLQWAGSLVGEWWAAETVIDLTLDPLSGVVGAFMAASAFAPALWRRRMRILTFALLLVFALYDGDSSNVYRLIAGCVGFGLGIIFSSSQRKLSWYRSSHGETRSLLSLIVAVTAIGPVISLINPSNASLLGLVSDLFSEAFPNVNDTLAQCAFENSPFCASKLAIVSAYGVGPVVLIFVPLALLLIAAYGMRKGRRFALWLAIGVNIALAILSFFALDVVQTLAQEGARPFTLRIGEYTVLIFSATLLPAVLAAILWANKKHFAIRASRQAVIRFSTMTAVTFVLLSIVWIFTGLLAFSSFVPPISVGDLFLDVPRRFLPANFVGTIGTRFFPSNDIALFVFQWVGPIFWLIVLIEIIRIFRSTQLRVKAGDYERVRALLRNTNGGTLGHMATWPGNAYWLSEDNKAAVAYQVITGVAIALTDPICVPERSEQTIHEFVAFCDTNSWVPVFYSIHKEYVPIFDRMGWQNISVGEETLLNLSELEMTGKQWSKVRHPSTKAIKAGMTTQWAGWNELPLTLKNEIKELSEQWVSEKKLPELGFTLGGIEEIKDPDVKLMLALGADGHLQAITSWLPVYRCGRRIGWTLDFMRRADNSMNGVMEFLIASAALHMKTEGLEILSLSGAPFAKKPHPTDTELPPSTLMTRLLDFLAKTLEPAYGFSSLFRYKAKFNPHYETLSMAYHDPLALPTIGLAITKAYLPEASTKEYVALIRSLNK